MTGWCSMECTGDPEQSDYGDSRRARHFMASAFMARSWNSSSLQAKYEFVLFTLSAFLTGLTDLTDRFRVTELIKR